MTKAAEAAGVSRRTVTRWLNDDDVFQGAIDKALAIATDELLVRWAAIASTGPGQIAKVLQDETTSPTIRIRAIALVNDILGKLLDRRDMERRLQRLERMLSGNE